MLAVDQPPSEGEKREGGRERGRQVELINGPF